jgi:hypothetical protein
LDYGYHSSCHHPNYFFNSFLIGCIGLLSGSPFVGLFWVVVRVFWECTQIGPALESYMANNYGEKWERYCQQFWNPNLIVQYLGTKQPRSRLLEVLPCLTFQSWLQADEDDDDYDNDVHNKKN